MNTHFKCPACGFKANNNQRKPGNFIFLIIGWVIKGKLAKTKGGGLFIVNLTGHIQTGYHKNPHPTHPAKKVQKRN